MHLNAKQCETYYCSQVGSGGPYFHGVPFQRGYGFFGDLKRYITPLALKAGSYLGKRLLETGKNVISDVASGSTFRDSAGNRIKETSKRIKKDVFENLQHGKGIKRKRNRKACQSKRKRCKTTHADIFSSL